MQVVRQCRDTRNGGRLVLVRIGLKHYVFRYRPGVIEAILSTKQDGYWPEPLKGLLTDAFVAKLCRPRSKLSATVLYCNLRDMTRKAVNIIHGIPKGQSLLKGRAVSLCKEMGFPYRKAMNDYLMFQGKIRPNFCGILVSTKTAELVGHIQNVKRGVVSGDDKVCDWLVRRKIVSRQQLARMRKAQEDRVVVGVVDSLLDS